MVGVVAVGVRWAFVDFQSGDFVAFVSRSIEQTEREKYVRWPDEPADPDRLFSAFGQFGLPDRLEA